VARLGEFSGGEVKHGCHLFGQRNLPALRFPADNNLLTLCIRTIVSEQVGRLVRIPLESWQNALENKSDLRGYGGQILWLHLF
jgi:hypothetical protein